MCALSEKTQAMRLSRLTMTPDAYELVKDELVNSDREMLLSVMLTVKNDLIGVETVSIGSITASTTTPRDIFKSAILANAVAIICMSQSSFRGADSKQRRYRDYKTVNCSGRTAWNKGSGSSHRLKSRL